MTHFEKVKKILRLAGGQFSIDNGDDFRLPEFVKKFRDAYYIERNQDPEVLV